MAKRLIADGAIGKPTHLRIKTVVGPDRLRVPGRPRRRRLRLADHHPEPGRPPLRRHDPQVRGRPLALRPGHRVRAGRRPPARLLLRAVRGDLRVRGPGLLGIDGGRPTPRRCGCAAPYYGADEFFEIQGDDGFLWVTRCTGRDARPARRRALRRRPGQQTTTSFTDVDADWGAGFRRSSTHFVDALVDGAPAEMSADRGDQGAPALLRRLRGRQHPPARSTRTITGGGPERLASVTLRRTGADGREGHPDPPPQSQRRGQPRSEPSRSTGTPGTCPRTPAPRSPGSAGTGSRQRNAQLHLVDAPAGDGPIRPTGPHVCFAVTDLEAAIAELDEAGIEWVRAWQGTTDTDLVVRSGRQHHRTPTGDRRVG